MIDDIPAAGAAYSLGVGGDVSWDLDIASRGLTVYQYDHTVPAPPSSHPNFTFHKMGIGPECTGEFTSIGAALAKNGHQGRRDLLLKIDIECAEWDALGATSDADIGSFQQIVAEFHGFLRCVEPGWRTQVQSVLGRLFRSHAVYHVHANNWGDYQVVEGIPIPDVLEVSYIRRDRFPLLPSTEFFPTSFDVPCHPEKPEYILGSFRFM